MQPNGSGVPMTDRAPAVTRTLVVQSFRRTEVPDWIQRCLDSVRQWTRLRGFDYTFYGDEFYDLCGPDYLARVGGNPRSITNLARLEITRIKLAEGYDAVIWFDADVFVFDVDRMIVRTDAGYAFSHEAWVTKGTDGRACLAYTSLHNAAFIFTRRQTDLELFIQIIRHIVMTRTIGSNYQVGVRLISGLAYSMDIPVITCVGMFSPDVIDAIADDRRRFMRDVARFHGHKMQAANLGWSQAANFTEARMMRAMDRLESSAGDVLNGYLDSASGGSRMGGRPLRLLRRWLPERGTRS
jgi:hypothetical protein